MKVYQDMGIVFWKRMIYIYMYIYITEMIPNPVNCLPMADFIQNFQLFNTHYELHTIEQTEWYYNFIDTTMMKSYE